MRTATGLSQYGPVVDVIDDEEGASTGFLSDRLSEPSSTDIPIGNHNCR